MSADDEERAAHAAWDRGNLKLAFRRFLALASSGETAAWLNLGYFYDNGLGTSRDRGKALLWYRRAFRNGSGAAASNIATIYRDERNYRLEVAWYRRAAALDDGDAAVELAKHFLSGSGVRRHRGHAITYLERALATDHISSEGRAEASKLLRRARAMRLTSGWSDRER